MAILRWLFFPLLLLFLRNSFYILSNSNRHRDHDGAESHQANCMTDECVLSHGYSLNMRQMRARDTMVKLIHLSMAVRFFSFFFQSHWMFWMTSQFICCFQAIPTTSLLPMNSYYHPNDCYSWFTSHIYKLTSNLSSPSMVILSLAHKK